jgi:hypothetical protein
MRSRRFNNTVPPCRGFLWPRAAHLGRAGIFGIDSILRRWYGVRAYSSSDNALLRISPAKATTHLVLADGTRVTPGDAVIDLHIWNERVPTLGLPGRNLFWACRVRNRIRHSLSELAQYLEVESDLGRYVAVRAEAFPLTERAARTLTRVAARFGLTQASPELPADWGHGMLVWFLAWACNPGSVSGKQLRPFRHEFWMSAAELRARYLMELPALAIFRDNTGSKYAIAQVAGAPVPAIACIGYDKATVGAFNDQ